MSSASGVQLVMDSSFVDSPEGPSFVHHFSELLGKKKYPIGIEYWASPVFGACFWKTFHAAHITLPHVLIIFDTADFLRICFDSCPCPTEARVSRLSENVFSHDRFEGVQKLIRQWRCSIESIMGGGSADIALTFIIRDLDKELLSLQKKRASKLSMVNILFFI